MRLSFKDRLRHPKVSAGGIYDSLPIYAYERALMAWPLSAGSTDELSRPLTPRSIDEPLNSRLADLRGG